MIYALALGRKRSVGFPGKNLHSVLGRPLAYYPLNAAKESSYINEVYLSTDSPALMRMAESLGVKIIKRPSYLCTDKATGLNAFIHGYKIIKKMHKERQIELMVLLFCNAATILTGTINKGIEALRENPELDSAVTVSRYNMWSPLRARRIGQDSLLHPFVPFEIFGNQKRFSCNRDSQGDVWFADVGVSVVRPRCLDNPRYGILPQRWMGQRIYPLKQWGGCDVDYEWQVPQVEFWLKKHGFSEAKIPYVKKDD